MTKSLRKYALALIAGLIVIACGVYGSMRLGLWNTRYDAVAAKYAAAPSKFITLDGVRLHYRDEGTGRTLVLLHGSFSSLHEWDSVADRLKRRFRIVRMDWPPYGLSQDPSGVYSTQRAAILVAALVDHLKLDRFVLVGTSNGGNVALAYAAAHPEHVDALALSVLPLRPVRSTRPASLRAKVIGWFSTALPNYHPRWWYRELFTSVSGPDFEAPPAVLEDYYQENNLPGALQHQSAYLFSNYRAFKDGDSLAAARAITVPVLLQWCDQDPVIGPKSRGEQARDDFQNAHVTLIHYPNTGHFPMLEIPDRFSADLAAFVETLPRRP